jgi:hypothetical protein
MGCLGDKIKLPAPYTRGTGWLICAYGEAVSLGEGDRVIPPRLFIGSGSRPGGLKKR